MKTSELTARQIIDVVVEGELGKGSKLPHEQAMIERFKVGRASLREALRLLEVQGLISLKAGVTGGPVVEEPTPEALGRTLSLFFRMSGATYGDLAAGYLALMPLIVRLAAHRPDRELLAARLERSLAHGAQANLEGVERMDAMMDFHVVLNELCGNSVLSLITTALYSLFAEHVLSISDPAEILPHCGEDHHAIAEAVISGEADRAVSLVDTHMRRIVAFHHERVPQVFSQRVSWR